MYIDVLFMSVLKKTKHAALHHHTKKTQAHTHIHTHTHAAQARDIEGRWWTLGIWAFLRLSDVVRWVSCGYIIGCRGVLWATTAWKTFSEICNYAYRSDCYLYMQTEKIFSLFVSLYIGTPCCENTRICLSLSLRSLSYKRSLARL